MGSKPRGGGEDDKSAKKRKSHKRAGQHRPAKRATARDVDNEEESGSSSSSAVFTADNLLPAAPWPPHELAGYPYATELHFDIEHEASSGSDLAKTPPLKPWKVNVDPEDVEEPRRSAATSARRRDREAVAAASSNEYTTTYFDEAYGDLLSLPDDETASTSVTVEEASWFDHVEPAKFSFDSFYTPGIARPYTCRHNDCLPTTKKPKWKTFKTHSDLGKHQLFHLPRGSRPHVCMLCTNVELRMDFSIAKDLRRHLFRAHGVGDPKESWECAACAGCHTMFSRKDGLQRHIKKCSKICAGCYSTFEQTDELQRHMHECSKVVELMSRSDQGVGSSAMTLQGATGRKGRTPARLLAPASSMSSSISSALSPFGAPINWTGATDPTSYTESIVSSRRSFDMELLDPSLR